ncbi:Hypothetical_protein [Hexamita inflata]|uniref:Hypothetical_protein n=1 Tax=Hexamita inflata TaxID=28002 RepID=A0ABP1K293_9EUKA
MDVELVAQLPFFRYYSKRFLRQDLPGGLLFTMNDKLYVHNAHEKQFEIRDNQLHCINKKHHNTYYYQFCDKVIAIKSSGIFTVASNLKLTQIAPVYRVKMLFTNGGTLVMTNNGDQYQTIIFNILDMILNMFH